MQWEACYSPPDPFLWQSSADVPANAYFFQRMQFVNLLKNTPKKVAGHAFALIGFKSDGGIQPEAPSASGTDEGPDAIRESLASLPLQNPDIQCYDAGNIICTGHHLEASQSALAEMIALLLEEEICPLVLGGSHQMAWGHYQGIIKHYPPSVPLGILNFDAHFDLCPIQSLSDLANASTAFYQIAESHHQSKRHLDYNCIGIQHTENIRQLFETAKKLRTKLILADEVHLGLQEKCFDFIDRIIDTNAIIYTSLSLDVFSPAFAPGVNAIQPLGLTPWQVIPLIRQIASSSKAVSYDVAGLVPQQDISHRTAKLAASLIYEIIHHHHPAEKK